MSLIPGLQLPFGIQPVNPAPVDAWSGPYSGEDESSALNLANSTIPSGVRFQSMEVRLIIDGISRKYWYRDGILDQDLVEFVSGSGGTIVNFEDTETIGFTQSGDTYSAFIKPDSITVSNLKTVEGFGPTAGYLLSNDGLGNFKWVDPSVTEATITVEDYATGQTFSGVNNIIFRGGLVNTPTPTAGSTATGVLVAGPSPTVTVWIPAPPQAVYASHFNIANDGNTNGSVSRTLSVFNVRISSPTNEGNPFQTGSWAGANHPATRFSTPSISTGANQLVTGFSPAGVGDSKITVTVYKADGNATFSVFTTPVLNGDANHTDGAGITVSITGYTADDSGFPEIYDTKWKAKPTITVDTGMIFTNNNLDGGRYKIKVEHFTDTLTDGGVTYSFITADVFYDTNQSTPSIGGTTAIEESTNPNNIQTKFISGVQYYIGGSQFEITTTAINNLNQNTQGFSNGAVKNFTATAPNFNLPQLNLQAWNPGANNNFIGWTNQFDLQGVTFSKTNWTISNSTTFRYRGSGASASAQVHDPWGNSQISFSPNNSILIDQVTDNSTRLGESFNGETERLIRGSSTYSAWVSSSVLGTSISNQTGTGPFCDACIVGGYLVRPDKYWLSSGLNNLEPNLSDFKPNKDVNNPNYSSHNQIATYHRRFYTQSALNIPSFQITFSGSWPSSHPNALAALEASQLKVYIRRISSSTGNFGPGANPLCLHGSTYNANEFDDDFGTLDSVKTSIRTGIGNNNNIINATFGGKPANVGFWMELQIVNPDIKIDFINVTLIFANNTTDSATVT